MKTKQEEKPEPIMCCPALEKTKMSFEVAGSAAV
jgi:hypothetical protein